MNIHSSKPQQIILNTGVVVTRVPLVEVYAPYPDMHLVASQRKQWYNAMLDPYVQANKMTDKMREAVENGTYDDGTADGGGELHEPDHQHPPILVSSLCKDGFHRPAFDVDVPYPDASLVAKLCAWVAKVPEEDVLVIGSTNNWHVYMPYVKLNHIQYFDFLEKFVDANIVELKYVEHSLNRQQSLLRLPGVRKSF